MISVMYIDKDEADKKYRPHGLQITLDWASLIDAIGPEFRQLILADAMAQDVLIECLARSVGGNRHEDTRYGWFDYSFPPDLISRARMAVLPLVDQALRDEVERMKKQLDDARELNELARTYVRLHNDLPGYSEERGAAWVALRKKVTGG